MTESEVVDLKLSANLLMLMMDEKIPFEKKKGKADYLIKVGADVNANVYGKSMALWVKELGDEEVIKYIKENGGVEAEISKEKSDELGKQFWDKSGKLESVKEIKELVLMGADLSVKNNNDEQIWKNLSLEEMNEVLKDLPKGYVIEGDVDLAEKGLIELPDFSKIKVGGGFDCSWNQLTTLQGVPSKVGGSFVCSGNQLTDLKDAPKEVGGDFYCDYNELTDLKGAPSEVGGDFDCCDSGLTTLKGAPREVGGDFKCSFNQLTDLKGAPEKVGGDFNCSDNQLTTLQEAPSEVGGYFDCERNKLTTLERAPKSVGRDFWCYGNQLTTLEGKPLKIGGEFKIEDEVLARIEELEKQKKNNAVMGAMTDKFEM